MTKQEGIPVGCIQTTVVAATDVRTWEGSTYWSGVCLLGGCLALRGSALHPTGWTMGQTTPPPPGWTMGRVYLLEWGVPTRGCLALRGSALHPTRWTMGQTTPPPPGWTMGQTSPPGWTHKHKQNIEFRPKFREIVENGGILCRKCI